MTVTIANGVVVLAGTHNTTTTVDLSSLPDDASITSTLALDSDAAGNSFTTVATVVASAANQTLTGSAASDTFVFNLPPRRPGYGYQLPCGERCAAIQ